MLGRGGLHLLVVLIVNHSLAAAFAEEMLSKNSLDISASS